MQRESDSTQRLRVAAARPPRDAPLPHRTPARFSQASATFGRKVSGSYVARKRTATSSSRTRASESLRRPSSRRPHARSWQRDATRGRPSPGSLLSSARPALLQTSSLVPEALSYKDAQGSPPHPPQLIRSADQLVQVVLTPLAGVRLDVLHRPEAAPHRRAAQRALLVPPPVAVAGLPAVGKHPPSAAP